ncbi:o-succinylbenzoate--CoA ligase [Nakamurella sp. UYEF19]|uniref:o-succinylbenzoate--CoA ligase n=1 Tax=Nakamurella sp. UYEF19 TaxID=1756392 RepID=UPI00339A8109
MPTGPALLEVLPRLARAIEGTGPALAPVAIGDHHQIELLTAAFGIGAPLSADEDDPDDPTVIVIATSGSTGTPKGTLLTRSALTASAAATAQRLGPPGTWLLALPTQHIAGLQVLLRSLTTGTTPHVLDTGLPFTPERFVTSTRSLPDGPRYLSLVPTQLQRVLTDDDATTELRTFTAVLVGGAATAGAVLQRAGDAGINVVTTYGMSETCGGCVYDGVPLDGIEVTLEPDGRIVLQGPMVGRGYRNLPGHPAFPLTTGQRHHTFRTDDLGEWADGRLRILGRIDDVIVTGGLKIAPTTLEEAIARLPGVAEVLVVGVPDATWGQSPAALVVPIRATDQPDTRNATAQPDAPSLADLRAACDQAGIPRALHPRSLTLVRELPLRGPGKPDRTAAVTLVASAAVSATMAPTPSQPG